MCNQKGTDMAASLYDIEFTNQKNLYGSKNVQGSSEGGSQVQTKSHSTSKLWTQGSGDHVIRATGCQEVITKIHFTSFISTHTQM